MMNLTPTAPRFGRLDTTPLRQADIPRSLIPVADAIADGFDSKLKTDAHFARVIADAEKDGLDLKVTGDFFQDPDTRQSTLGVMASLVDRATGEGPKVNCSTGAGRGGIGANEATEDGVNQILGRIFYYLYDDIRRVSQQLKLERK